MIENIARVSLAFQTLHGVRERSTDDDGTLAADAARTVRSFRREEA